MPAETIPAATASTATTPTRGGSTIAIVGASARAAAFSLLRVGKQVVAADLFADADLARHCAVTRVSPYPDGCTAWLAETECDGWLYTGALENNPELVDRLTTLRPLLGHAGNVLRRVRDPLQLQAVLSREGLHFPETRSAAEPRPTDGAWLGKTYRGSCGSGVGVAHGALFWQRAINGTPLSAVFVGGKLLGVTRQLVGESWACATEFKYCGSIGPWPLPTEIRQQLVHLGVVLGAEFELKGIYGVDLMCDGERIWAIEVNPRYTAAVEVVERAYGVSVFGSQGFQRHDSPLGKVVLYAKVPLAITAELHAQLMQQTGDLNWPRLADIPVLGTEIAAGQPVLTLFAEADSCEAVARRLQQRVDEIEQQLYGGTP